MGSNRIQKIFNGRSTESLIGLLLTASLGFILYAIATWAAWRSTSNTPDRYLNIGLLNLGAALGWLLGVFLSPDNADEQSRFTRYGTAIGSFISGYVLSKSEGLLKALGSADFWNYTHALQAVLLLIGLLAATMVAFTLRAYFVFSQKRIEIPSFEFQLTNQPIKLNLGKEVANATLLRLTRVAGNSAIQLGRTRFGSITPFKKLEVVNDKPIVRLANEIGNGPDLVARTISGTGACLRVELLEANG